MKALIIGVSLLTMGCASFKFDCHVERPIVGIATIGLSEFVGVYDDCIYGRDAIKAPLTAGERLQRLERNQDIDEMMIIREMMKKNAR